MSIAGNRPFHSSEFPHSWLGDVAARDEEDHERSNSVFPEGRQPGADPRVGSLAEQLAVRLRRFSQDKKMTSRSLTRTEPDAHRSAAALCILLKRRRGAYFFVAL